MAKMDDATRKRALAERLMLAGQTPAHAAKADSPMATSISPTCGQSNSSRQDGRSIDWFPFVVQ